MTQEEKDRIARGQRDHIERLEVENTILRKEMEMWKERVVELSNKNRDLNERLLELVKTYEG